MSKFINNGFIDTFRFFNSNPHEYTWWSYRANARANNKGWRLDYALASETLKEKPSFKKARRCLIIADGWYEWSRNGPNKQPFYFHLNDNIFAFAGIYTSYQGVNGCAIITREANQNISDIHHRMPVILDKKDENLWLNGDDIFNSELSEQIEYYPVRKIVNSPRNNSTECIKQESI